MRRHFDVLEAVVADHEGAIVKTTGDASMASFGTPDHAARASIEMVRRHNEHFSSEELGLKVGAHSGPCLAVRANDRLDFFGATMDLAARLQGKAGGSELVLAERVATLPSVAEALQGSPTRALGAHLKGIDGEQRLYAFALDAAEQAQA